MICRIVLFNYRKNSANIVVVVVVVVVALVVVFVVVVVAVWTTRVIFSSGTRIFLIPIRAVPIQGSTQPPILSVPRASSRRLKRPSVRQTTHPDLVLTLWPRGAITPLSHTPSWRGTWLSTETTVPYFGSNSRSSSSSGSNISMCKLNKRGAYVPIVKSTYK
jgi:hypothetical protein